MFSKRVWSYLDFKEDVNKKTFNNYNQKLKIFPLYDILNAWIKQGKISCFNYSNFGSTKNAPVTLSEFKRLIIKQDSIEERVIVNDDSEKIIKRLKVDTISNTEILGFLIKEDWFFNQHLGSMEKKIIGFAPVYYDRKAQKQKELYWVYYAQCCELLSSCFTYNASVEKGIFTFKKLFEKRFYSSYVIKESNVYDRDKPENSKGLEIDTENRNNKEKFESSEDDLWPK